MLDDYHLAEGPDIQPGMAFLLDHLPPQVHLVISTRADPALPLARLRARGELVEVRAADLRFTGDEAAAYLNDVNALGLEPADVAALEDRTEGWAAALQLAALSLQGRDDRVGSSSPGSPATTGSSWTTSPTRSSTGSPPDVRRFLLETSILDRLTGPLCDAVTGRTDGKAMLESLERQNLFVVPLDDHRRWYRYHHLFADVLRARLLDERPGDEAELHRRASDWYDQAGDPEAAVRHALAAGDVDLAADRVELAMPGLRRERREAVIRRWIDELPADIVRNRPVLAVGFIGAPGGEQRVRRHRSSGCETSNSCWHVPVDDSVVVDEAELARLPAVVETYRAALALVARRPGRHRGARGPRAGPRHRRRPHHDRLRVGPRRARVLDRWGPGRGTRRVPSRRGQPVPGGARRRRPRLHHHADRHRVDPGAAG